jgi:mono/diheme cytochrome c family protein
MRALLFQLKFAATTLDRTTFGLLFSTLMKIKLILLVASVALSVSLLSFQEKPKFDLKASVTRGKEVYASQCISCHMEQGEGIEGVYPPLAKADYLKTDKNVLAGQLLHGLSGEIKVNGVVYNGEMTPFEHLSDQEISDVLNYVRNSWGNKGDAVRPEDVKGQRK